MTKEILGGGGPESGGDIGSGLGASAEGVSVHVLSLYIPNKDKEGNEFGTQRMWLLEAGELLAKIGGGFTIMPPVEGGWVNPDSHGIVWENPVVIYTYVKSGELERNLPALREFLHRMGRETQQGEVALEFNNRFYRIGTFDEGSGAGTIREVSLRRYNTPPYP